MLPDHQKRAAKVGNKVAKKCPVNHSLQGNHSYNDGVNAPLVIRMPSANIGKMICCNGLLVNLGMCGFGDLVI